MRTKSHASNDDQRQELEAARQIAPGKRTRTQQVAPSAAARPRLDIDGSAGASAEIDHTLAPGGYAEDASQEEGEWLGYQGEDATAKDARDGGGESHPHGLPPFDELIAQASSTTVPDDLRCVFEATHFVDLRAVRIYHVPELEVHGAKGLSRGREILLADMSDRDTLAHELGHVVDTTLTGAASPNARLGGVEIADDPARELRANALAAQRGQGQATNAGGALRTPAAGGAALPKLTKRSAIRGRTRMQWEPHRTKVSRRTAQGVGATLSSSTPLSYTATSKHGQLETLTLTIPSEHVDPSRPALPAPQKHVSGHEGAYVVPSALLGSALPENLLYLPTKELVALQGVQKDIAKLAGDAPGRLVVTSTFGSDGLVDVVDLAYEALDRVGTSVYQVQWKPTTDTNRRNWTNAGAGTVRTSSGSAPTATEWKTDIAWDRTNAAGDGVKMTATKLGPDHGLGSAPSNDTSKSRVKQLQAAAKPKKGKGEAYIAGHLLNDHLGGPGDLAANLAPIPKKANSQMSASVETKAKELVNEKHGWIFYEVTVTHNTDPAIPTLTYPSQIKAELGALNATGAKTNPQIVTIDIAAPSQFAGKTASAPAASGKLTNTVTETSPVLLDEVILTQQDEIGSLIRGGAEIFNLIANSEMNVELSSAAHATAWTNALKELHTFSATVRPKLDMLLRVRDGVEAWNKFDTPPDVLTTTKVEEITAALSHCTLAAATTASKVSSSLAAARASLKRDTIEPSELFKSHELFSMMEKLIQDAAPKLSIAAWLRSNHSGGLASRKHERDMAETNKDSVAVATADKYAADYKKGKANANAGPPVVPTPSSPVGLFETFDETAAEIEADALGGFALESERAKKIASYLDTQIKAKDSSAMAKALTDATVTKSDRGKAVLTMAAFLADCAKANNANAGAEASASLLHADSLQTMARTEPQTIKALVALFGIK